jgi:hypothetical protein
MTNSQDLLWSITGDWYWRGYALICAVAALCWFKMLLDSSVRDAAFYARILMLSGFILGAFVRVNSACQPLSGALLATGGAFWGLLAVTRWRHRPGRARDKALAIVRECAWGVQKQPRQPL